MTTTWFALWVLMAVAIIHSYLLYQIAKVMRMMGERINRIDTTVDHLSRPSYVTPEEADKYAASRIAKMKKS